MKSNKKILLIIGAERFGVSPELLRLSTASIHLPMLGVNTFSALLFAVSGLFTKSVVIVFLSDADLEVAKRSAEKLRLLEENERLTRLTDGLKRKLVGAEGE